MAQEVTDSERALANLERARAHLVEQRRLVVEALAVGYARGNTENQMANLGKFQEAIDIITRLRDEERRDKPTTGFNRPL